jgi:pimeloyl-ACP methyl ester carboxylesterase
MSTPFERVAHARRWPRIPLRSLTILPLIALSVASCERSSTPAARDTGWTDQSPHEIRMVAVNGVKLQLLDWGGQGDGLVFIHGLGDSPHAWDDIAPAFTDRFRVIAYARRSHGRSEFVMSPLDNETLVEDLRQLLDSLGIRRAVLAGWSMGGNEITRFAELYPDRTSALIYVEAGYDWSDTTVKRLFGTAPLNWVAGPAERASFAPFRNWWIDVFWPGGTLTPAAEAELRDVIAIDSAGRVTVTTDTLMEPLFASAMGYHRNYAAVKAPVLDLHAGDFLPPSQPDSVRAAVAAWNDEFRGFQRASIERMKRELGGPFEAHVIPGTMHSAFPWMARDTLVSLMRGFLH